MEDEAEANALPDKGECHAMGGFFSEARTPALWHRRKKTVPNHPAFQPVGLLLPTGIDNLLSSLLHLFLIVTLGAKFYDPYLVEEEIQAL